MGSQATRGIHTYAVAIEQDRKKHLRVIAARTTTPRVFSKDRRQVQLANHVAEEQGQMSIGQPFSRIHR